MNTEHNTQPMGIKKTLFIQHSWPADVYTTNIQIPGRPHIHV